MTVFQFILAALACYRATVLIARDVGPWDVFKRLRKVARFTKLLSCPFCVSVWVATAIETAFYFSGIRDSLVVSVCIVLSFSAIAVILDRTFTSDIVN